MRTILIQDDDKVTKAAYVYICSSYLVEDGKVLLVHHNEFDKWVPPGGHIEPGDTFAETAVREVKEETGYDVEIISAQPAINPRDKMATPEPVPFYVDIEYAFKPRPAIVQFFWARRKGTEEKAAPIVQATEVYDVRWFSKDELQTIPTFDQVRSAATHALSNHPDAIKS